MEPSPWWHWYSPMLSLKLQRGYTHFTSLFSWRHWLNHPWDLALCRMLRRKRTRGSVAPLQAQKFLHILVSLAASQWGRTENKRQSKECLCSAASLSHHQQASLVAVPEGCSARPWVARPSPCTTDFEAAIAVNTERIPVLWSMMFFPGFFPVCVFIIFHWNSLAC